MIAMAVSLRTGRNMWLAIGLLMLGLIVAAPVTGADNGADGRAALDLFRQGEALRSQGRTAEAATAYETALGWMMQNNHPRRFAVMARLGTLRMDQGQMEDGQRLLNTAVNGLQEIGDYAALANTLLAVANLHIRHRNPDGALQTTGWIIDLGHAQKNDRILVVGHNGQAMVHRAGGNPDLAARSYEQALAAARRAGDRLMMAQVWSGQAGLILDQGNQAEACRRFGEVLQAFRDINQPQWVANTQREMAKAGCE